MESTNWLASAQPFSTPQSLPVVAEDPGVALYNDPDVVTAEQNGSPVFGLLAQLLRTRESFQLQQMSRVDSYRNITRIGEGATYVVDKRTDLESEDQLIAVKTAKFTVPKGAGYMITINSPEFRRLKSVLLEVEILAHPPLQSHPNIPDLLGIAWDVDSPGFTPQLVMELATHGSLSSFLKTNRLSDTEQIDCCLDIAQALETLHKCMIVHGDVKQDNVLVFPHTERRIVTKLSDFEHAVLRTDKLCYLGTQIYNAPEVHRVKNGKAAFTHFKELFACDAFAFGLLVFEIFLGGRRYFSVDDGQLFQDMLFDTSWDQTTDLLTTAMSLLESRIDFSPLIQQVCGNIFNHTIRSKPTDRLPLGWRGINEILNIQNWSPVSVVGTLKLDNIFETLGEYSILSIILNIENFHSGLLGDQLIAELKHRATSGRCSVNMAKASFSLCLAFSSAQMLTSLTRDEALNLLAKAAVLGHRAASLIGPRVFEANEHQVPASLEERLEDLNIDNRVPTDLDAEETFFANAVKDLFGRELRAKLRRRLSRRGIIERTGQLIPWINEQNKNLQTDDYLINFAEESLLLHASIAFEDVEAANFLLDMGCTVDLEGPEGLTPLLIACQCANKTLINVLLTHGADASKTGHDGVTTLHWLILFPHRDIKDTLEALVSHGADIDRSMKQGTYMCFDGLSLALENTALSWAVLCRDHSVVSALLQAGAKEDLESSMKFALRLVCPDVAEILMTHGRDRCQFFTENPWYDIGDETSREFQRWVIHGKKYASAYARTMDWLISHGSDYPGCWKDTNSPMYHAVMCCNIPLAEELLKRGADISEVGRTSRATLLAALISCDVVELSDSSKKMRMAKLLLNNGVPLEPGPYDENFPTKTFLSGPIHLACVFKAPLSMIELLSGYCIEHINRRYNGKTPLQALPGAHSDEETAQIVRYLLSLKADPEAETTHWNMWGEGFWNCCHRPIALVARNRYLASTVTLLDYGVSPIMGVSGNHQFTVLHELVREAMRDMQRRDDFSSGEKRMADFIDLVLDHPLPQKDDWVNIADSQGYTVIWYAIHWGLPATVEVLLNHNAKREGLQHGADLKAVLSYSYEHPPSFVQDAGEYETILFMCSYISPTNSSGYKHRLGKISKLLSMAG